MNILHMLFLSHFSLFRHSFQKSHFLHFINIVFSKTQAVIFYSANHSTIDLWVLLFIIWYILHIIFYEFILKIFPYFYENRIWLWRCEDYTEEIRKEIMSQSHVPYLNTYIPVNITSFFATYLLYYLFNNSYSI